MKTVEKELDKLMTTEEFEAFTGIKKETLATWRFNGKGPNYSKAAGKRGTIYYSRADYEKWKSANKLEYIVPQKKS